MLFGSAPIDVHELVQVLETKVQPEAARRMGLTPGDIAKLTPDQKWKTREWTQAVKHVLNDRGQESGYQVYCSGIEQSCELLLDILWCAGSSATMGIALACESEWNENPNEVSWDFQKLMFVKAPLKLLIYTGGRGVASGEQILARIKKDLESYPHHVAEEQYLLVGLDWGVAYAHRYVVPSDGQQAGISFELLEKAD